MVDEAFTLSVTTPEQLLKLQLTHRGRRGETQDITKHRKIYEFL
jgi:hypothetical protein